MPRQSEVAKGIAYPQLSRDQIDLIIYSLLATVRDRNLGSHLDLAEQTISKLADFHTRRWGLPPSIREAMDRRLSAGQDR